MQQFFETNLFCHSKTGQGFLLCPTPFRYFRRKRVKNREKHCKNVEKPLKFKRKEDARISNEQNNTFLNNLSNRYIYYRCVTTRIISPVQQDFIDHFNFKKMLC
jgi:hypothetical protein